ncbi:MAG: flavin reductase family protein [Pseudomonadota bacterium]
MDLASIPAEEVQASFRAAMRRYASTVTIVTAADGSRSHGMTMTAVSSLSMTPPSMIVCVNQSTYLHEILLSAKRFCVNVLRQDQSDVSTAFSGALPSGQRFSVGDWRQGGDDLHYLHDAQANVFCKKVAAIPFGTHTIFVGTAERVLLSDDSKPLLYHNASYC